MKCATASEPIKNQSRQPPCRWVVKPDGGRIADLVLFIGRAVPGAMMHRRCPRLATLLAVSVCTAAVTSLWPPAGNLRVDDRNGDGAPDMWRLYDSDGQLSEVDVDTNFDGQPDVQEYYEQGALIRRESDRDFDNRIDVVEEFDPTTHEHVRSIFDVDRDGAADLLVLVRGNQRVFTKWAIQPTSSASRSDSVDRTHSWQPISGNAGLTALRDPFVADLALRAVRAFTRFDDCVGVSTSGGLPTCRRDVVSAITSTSGLPGSPFSAPSSFTSLPGSPRGPPVLHPSA